MWLPEIYLQSLISNSCYTLKGPFFYFFVERVSYTVTETKVEMSGLTSESIIIDSIQNILRIICKYNPTQMWYSRSKSLLIINWVKWD